MDPECEWCKRVQKGDTRIRYLPERYCGKHRILWIAAASAALGYAQERVTKAKMVALLLWAEQEGKKVGKE